MSVDCYTFVDESKAKGYVVAAATLQDRDVPRKELRELVLPGQRALHMQTESASRRRTILGTLDRMHDQGMRVVILDAGKRYKTERASRRACLEQIVRTAQAGHELVIDRDETLVAWDKQQLVELRRAKQGGFRYRHATRQQELLLAVPDAIAWCWARGGEWRRQVRSIASEIVDV